MPAEQCAQQLKLGQLSEVIGFGITAKSARDNWFNVYHHNFFSGTTRNGNPHAFKAARFPAQDTGSHQKTSAAGDVLHQTDSASSF